MPELHQAQQAVALNASRRSFETSKQGSGPCPSRESRSGMRRTTLAVLASICLCFLHLASAVHTARAGDQLQAPCLRQAGWQQPIATITACPPEIEHA